MHINKQKKKVADWMDPKIYPFVYIIYIFVIYFYVLFILTCFFQFFLFLCSVFSIFITLKIRILFYFPSPTSMAITLLDDVVADIQFPLNKKFTNSCIFYRYTNFIIINIHTPSSDSFAGSNLKVKTCSV